MKLPLIAWSATSLLEKTFGSSGGAARFDTKTCESSVEDLVCDKVRELIKDLPDAGLIFIVPGNDVQGTIIGGPIIGTLIGGAVGSANTDDDEVEEANTETGLDRSEDNKTAAKEDKLGNFAIQPLMSETNEGDEGGEDNDSVAQKDLDDQDKQGNFEIQDLLSDKKNTTLR